MKICSTNAKVRVFVMVLAGDFVHFVCFDDFVRFEPVIHSKGPVSGDEPCLR